MRLRTKVYVTRLRVLEHHEYRCAEVTAAVQLVKLGRRKGQSIDLVAVEDNSRRWGPPSVPLPDEPPSRRH